MVEESKAYRWWVDENEVSEKNEEGGDKRSTAKAKQRLRTRTLKNGFTETTNISDLTVHKNRSGRRCSKFERIVSQFTIHWRFLHKWVGKWNEQLKILQEGKEPHKFLFNQVKWRAGELGTTNPTKVKKIPQASTSPPWKCSEVKN